MTSIFPIAQTAKLVNAEGKFTPEFKRYLDDTLDRIGGQNGGDYRALTYAPAVTWDVTAKPNAVLVLAGNTTITPVGMVAGYLWQPLTLVLVQDATGSRTVTWGSAFKFPSAVPPVLSTAGNAVDEIWFSTDGTNMKGMIFRNDLR